MARVRGRARRRGGARSEEAWRRVYRTTVRLAGHEAPTTMGLMTPLRAGVPRRRRSWESSEDGSPPTGPKDGDGSPRRAGSGGAQVRSARAGGARANGMPADASREHVARGDAASVRGAHAVDVHASSARACGPPDEARGATALEGFGHEQVAPKLGASRNAERAGGAAGKAANGPGGEALSSAAGTDGAHAREAQVPDDDSRALVARIFGAPASAAESPASEARLGGARIGGAQGSVAHREGVAQADVRASGARTIGLRRNAGSRAGAPAAGIRKRTRRGGGARRRRRLQRSWALTPTVAPLDDGADTLARAEVAGGRYRGLQLPSCGSPRVPVCPPGAMPPRSAYGSDGRWPVEALTAGDDMDDINGLVVAKRRMYAAGQAQSALDVFHPVDWDGELFADASEGEITYRTYAIAAPDDETPPCVVHPGRRTRQPRSVAVAGYVRAFLERNPGLAVVTAVVGARDAVVWPPHMRRHYRGQPRLTSKTHNSLHAAVVNAVFALRGEEAALRMTEVVNQEAGRYENIRPLGGLLQLAGSAVVRCRVERDEETQRAIQSPQRCSAFETLAAMRCGVFIVRLRHDGCVDHAVVVDANNGIVDDSEEHFALQLSAKVLQRCGGPSAARLRVAEVREVKKVGEIVGQGKEEGSNEKVLK